MMTSKEQSELTAYIMTLRPSLRAKTLRAVLAAREEPMPRRRLWRARIWLQGVGSEEISLGYFQTRRSATLALDGAGHVAKALGFKGAIRTEAWREATDAEMRFQGPSHRAARER
jgi:hypothetical protein